MPKIEPLKSRLAPFADLIPGQATRTATLAYTRTFGRELPCEHYSDFLNTHLKLSSLGLGTFPGAATDAIDAGYVAAIEQAVCSGINVFDTATHYRYGRSARALGEGLRRAFAQGVARDQVFLIGKGGFLLFEDGVPDDFDSWFAREIAGRGLGRREELTGRHLLTAPHISDQIDRLRALIGCATLDAFLIDQPEVHIPTAGKEQTHRRLEQCFAVCEHAVQAGKIGCYGIATFDGFRVQTDAPLFQSLTSLLGLAERAASRIRPGERVTHHFRLIELPFNQAMAEGFTRFNQATGQGNVGSTIQAAHQLKVFVVGSHGMMKGALGKTCTTALIKALPQCRNDAQRSLQFNRSTPGLGVSLTGVREPDHLQDLLNVAHLAPLDKKSYLQLYERAD